MKLIELNSRRIKNSIEYNHMMIFYHVINFIQLHNNYFILSIDSESSFDGAFWYDSTLSCNDMLLFYRISLNDSLISQNHIMSHNNSNNASSNDSSSLNFDDNDFYLHYYFHYSFLQLKTSIIIKLSFKI